MRATAIIIAINVKCYVAKGKIAFFNINCYQKYFISHKEENEEKVTNNFLPGESKCGNTKLECFLLRKWRNLWNEEIIELEKLCNWNVLKIVWWNGGGGKIVENR